MALNKWYRWKTDFDFSSHLVTEIRLTDLTTMTTWKNQHVGWYLRGGSAGAALPTGFRFSAGSGVAGNLLAFDNVAITLNSAGLKAVAKVFGAGVSRPNPKGRLFPGGLPLLDSAFAVGIHNPIATQAANSARLLFLADGKADPGFMVPLPIPPDCGLLRLMLYLQGLIVDSNPTSKVPLGLTEGIEMLIGNM